MQEASLGNLSRKVENAPRGAFHGAYAQKDQMYTIQMYRFEMWNNSIGPDTL